MERFGAAPGDPWTLHQVQHVSIAVMFFFAGSAGMMCVCLFANLGTYDTADLPVLTYPQPRKQDLPKLDIRSYSRSFREGYSSSTGIVHQFLQHIPSSHYRHHRLSNECASSGIRILSIYTCSLGHSTSWLCHLPDPHVYFPAPSPTRFDPPFKTAYGSACSFLLVRRRYRIHAVDRGSYLLGYATWIR